MKKYFAIIALGALAFSCTPSSNPSGPKQDTEEALAAAKGNVVFNELSGTNANGKWVEFYNLSEKTVDLEGCKILKGTDKDAAGEKVVWEGPAGFKIEAGKYKTLDSDGAVDADGNPADAKVYETNFIGGFSAKKSVSFRLVDKKGVTIDLFQRGPTTEAGLWGVTVAGGKENTEATFSRVPNGTGEFVYAAPSKGSANGEKTGEIEQE